MSGRAEPGEVIQLDPEKCRWGPVFVIVTELKAWGVQGYFHTTHADGSPGAAYIRVNHGDYERIGVAVWRVANAPEPLTLRELIELPKDEDLT